MPDNKLIDNEIIKAFEYCLNEKGTSYTCAACPYHQFGALCKVQRDKDAFDLINRLQEESKNKTAEIEELKIEINMFREYDEEIKAEAYKEFAENLKKKMVKHNFKYADTLFSANVATVPMVDNLLKELVGDSQ